MGTLPIGQRFGRDCSIVADPNTNRIYHLTHRTKTIRVFDGRRLTLSSTHNVQSGGTIKGSLVLIGSTGLAFRSEKDVVIIPLRDLAGK